MTTLVRTNASVAWLGLIALTVVSWALGADHGFGPDGHTAASLVILAVAIFKVRLIGLYFMELKAAPKNLRGVFEGYCAVVFALLAGTYLIG